MKKTTNTKGRRQVVAESIIRKEKIKAVTTVVLDMNQFDTEHCEADVKDKKIENLEQKHVQTSLVKSNLQIKEEAKIETQLEWKTCIEEKE